MSGWRGLSRWVKWLLVWAALAIAIALTVRAVIGPLLPPVFILAGALVAASGLTLLILPSPTEND
jgi:hypothetical protein